jgi:hypothetical protein
MSMSVIENLPLELLVAILQQLDNIYSLFSSLLTCHTFYNVYNEYPNVIKTAVFRRQLTPALLPYPIAALEASRLPPLNREASIREVITTLSDPPHHLTARLEALPLSTLLKLERTHQAIKSLVADFATTASNFLFQDSPDVSSDVIILSENESFRFFRSFYRFEIYFNIFPGAKGVLNFDPSESSDVAFFFSRYTAWELEQLVCIHNFLEEKILQGSLQIICLIKSSSAWSMGFDILSRLF